MSDAAHRDAVRIVIQLMIPPIMASSGGDHERLLVAGVEVLGQPGDTRQHGDGQSAAIRLAALLMAEAIPMWWSSTDASTVAVSGATVTARPAPSTTIPGRTPST